MKRIRIGAILVLFALLAMSFTVGAAQLPEQPGWWTGYNEALDDYYLRPGYPKLYSCSLHRRSERHLV